MSGVRDQPGPGHRPDVSPDAFIDGVVIQSSPFVEYGDDHVLTELYRPEWPGVFAPGELIEHLYTVHARSGGARSEWYFHEHTLDRYMVLQGRLDVGLYDGRPESATAGAYGVVSLGQPGSGLPNALRIPPLVWHSLKWQTPSGMFLNAKLPPYRHDTPDKFRIQPADLPDVITWNV